jgi:ABC-type phosphate transport system permease subunit/ABC-type phosphate transport system auxiliary subunit
MSHSPTSQPASPPATVDGAKRRASAKRGALLSGYSLLARGEPQIWFTGGMLVICLAMILGLLSYILYAGLPTFWPRPVQWLVLNDGTFEIGQYQASELADRSPGAALADTSPAAKTTATADPNVNVSQPIDRYYRTGNFDLTGQHYRWLTAQQLDAAGITQPTWAMVVERLENGRLYGLLSSIALDSDVGSQPRQERALYAELSNLVGSLPELEPELLSQVVEAIEQQQAIEWDRELRRVIELEVQAGGLPQVQMADTQRWIALSQTTADQRWTAARRLFTDEVQVYEQLKFELQRAGQLRQQADQLRYRISRLDGRLSELAAQVRRVEIATSIPIAQPLESSHYLLEQLEALAARQTRLTGLGQLLERVGAERTWRSIVLDKFDQYVRQSLPEEIQAVDRELKSWMAPIAVQPPPIVSAVEQYLAGYRQIVQDKLPWIRQLAELEERLALAKVRFSVPFAPRPLEVAQSDIQQLLVGQLSSGVQQALAAQAVEVQATAPSLTKLNPRCWLASLRDSSDQPLLLAIVAQEPSTAALDEPRGLGSNDPGSNDPTMQLQWLQSTDVSCAEIVRAFPANQLSLWNKISIYVDRWREFLTENPREANTEGGVFPAIWGTVVMTLIMTVAVVPFGVMAALYLREYTKSGPLVSLIRISINNLAGVPSIVYGVFGFSFFCYTIGAYLDGGPRNADIVPWPSTIWFLILGGVAVTGSVAFFASLISGGASHTQNGFKRAAARIGLLLWLVSVAVLALLILKSPFFDGFYREYLPNPTFGKGGLLWAALTLSLLTLPVVIVATEEALAAVPNSLREGSLACGASKWQTIYRIVLPHAQPGILTGAILAMARGAGEVAPLMLVGALASAPDLPLDSEFPFFHGSRSFMHLGYQIYTLGFQSQNSEAARPMVFTCTLLLILIVAVLNITAIFLRSRLKRQFQGSQF